MNKAAWLAVLIAPLVGPSAPSLMPASCPSNCVAARDDSALRLYAEALAQIDAQAVFGSSDATATVGKTLAAYLSSQDPYSGLLTRAEYAAYLATQREGYAGVGAELERRHDGDTLLYPFPDGPAARAGISAGDRLLAVGGVPVKGKPLAVLGAWVTGQPGTRVTLDVSGRAGGSRRVDVTRERVAQPDVSATAMGRARVLRLSRFTAATRASVEALLARTGTTPLVIDLRGCGGGDFHAAVDTAMLFLQRGEPIVTVSRRSGEQRYTSTIDGSPLAQPMFVWQDEHTASAAELFIGALTDNARATSVGRTSAGKGSRQDIVPLHDGSALILTTGYLSTPHGLRFDGRGLTPQRPVASGAGTSVYLSASGL